MNYAEFVANIALAAAIAGIFMCSAASSQQPTTLSSRNSSLATNRPLIRKPRLPSLPTRSRSSNEYRYFSTTNMTTTTTDRTTTDSIPLKQADILEISSTDDKLAVAWPVPRRPASKRFRPPSQISTTLSPLAKLRRPRPSRPAMYSLDGFVPKPSLQFKPTTEASADVLAWNNKQDLQALGSIARRRKVNFGNEANDDDNVRKYKTVVKKNSTRKASSSRVRPTRRKGVPGVDFPAFDFIPFTTFDCEEKGDTGGMFADPETKCQVWHLCPGGSNQYRHSFLCPNGTVFNERRTICDWWYNVDC